MTAIVIISPAKGSELGAETQER